MTDLSKPKPRWAVSCPAVRGYWELRNEREAAQLTGLFQSAGLDVWVRRIPA